MKKMSKDEFHSELTGIHDLRVELLLDLIGRINTRQGLTSLLDSVMEACKTITNSEAGSLMLLDRNEKELVVSVPTGPKKSEVTGKRIPIGTGISGWVARHREPLIVNDVSKDDRFHGEIRSDGFTTRNLICVPMVNDQGKLMGVIQAVNKKDGKDFLEEEIPLLMALANQAAICFEREYLHRKALDRERLDEQIKMARGIQYGFFPEIEPGLKSVDIAGSSQPAADVGGDYYDYIQLAKDRWGLAIADVTGKGVPAAMLMATIRAQVRSLADKIDSATETVAAINQALYKEAGDDKYITLFYGVLCDNVLSYTNAGHCPPLLYDPEANTFSELREGGPILGFLDNITYKQGKLELMSGMVLVLYTDGVTEAEDAAGNHFGEERLRDSIRRYVAKDASVIKDGILNEINEFRGTFSRSDDETVVVLKVL